MITVLFDTGSPMHVPK